jgi:hypothetical protein
MNELEKILVDVDGILDSLNPDKFTEDQKNAAICALELETFGGFASGLTTHLTSVLSSVPYAEAWKAHTETQLKKDYMDENPLFKAIQKIQKALSDEIDKK